VSLKADPERIRTLGILAGSGSLPRAVAEACRARGTGVFIVDLEGAASDWAGEYPGARVSLGQVGRVLTMLREAQCDAITMAGALIRPRLSAVRFDRKGLSLLPRVAGMFRRGDDGLLSGVATLFEEHGFPVVGAEIFLPQALAAEGAIVGAVVGPDDIDTARAILTALSPFDIGQAVVVAQGRCLAVEGPEGTAAMLARVAGMRGDAERGGVLVKMPKTGQDTRIDRPAIGPETIRSAVAAGLSGIAVEAGGVLVLDAERTERAAREAGVFLYGFAR